MEGWFNTRNMFQVHFQRFLKIAWKNRFPLQIFCRLKSYLEQPMHLMWLKTLLTFFHYDGIFHIRLHIILFMAISMPFSNC